MNSEPKTFSNYVKDRSRVFFVYHSDFSAKRFVGGGFFKICRMFGMKMPMGWSGDKNANAERESSAQYTLFS